MATSKATGKPPPQRRPAGAVVGQEELRRLMRLKQRETAAEKKKKVDSSFARYPAPPCSRLTSRDTFIDLFLNFLNSILHIQQFGEFKLLSVQCACEERAVVANTCSWEAAQGALDDMASYGQGWNIQDSVSGFCSSLLLKKKLEQLKELKQSVAGSIPNTSSSLKRKITNAELPAKKVKDSGDHPETVSSGLPEDFFGKIEQAEAKGLSSKSTSGNLLLGDYEEEEEEEEELEKEIKNNNSKLPLTFSVQSTATPVSAQRAETAVALPSGYVENKGLVTPLVFHSGSIQKAEVQEKLVERRENTAEALPEGFFDDPEVDAKVMTRVLEQIKFVSQGTTEQTGFRRGRGTRDQIAEICWIMEKAREFQKNIYFCFIDYAKVFDCVDHNKLWQILKEMGVPDHLICLLRNLYVGQEATVRTGHGTTDWFKIEKGVRQGCILSPCLFNLYAEHIMRKAGLDESLVGIEIAISTASDMQTIPL
ncbi:hypothetical protein EYD10_06099 [Varanus komodoensis]|nr:hypothetical protein EYD10_06099 [Varanus komodoensis]